MEEQTGDFVLKGSRVSNEDALWLGSFKPDPRECHDELVVMEHAFNDLSFISFREISDRIS